MITPQNIETLVNQNTTTVVNPYSDRDRFMEAVNRAETIAVQNIARCREAGQEPKKLRVKLDINWDESLIRGLVEEYKMRGWKRVSYNANDYGLREPQGYWTITIKME